MPDLDLVTPDGPVRVFELLHRARPVLLEFGGPRLGARGVARVSASYDGAWVLPVIGNVPAPIAVLVRPDGHVAWVGEGSADGLDDALATWFGALSMPRRE